MVLVDFTLAERWRVFGELSFAPVRGAQEQRQVHEPSATAAQAFVEHRVDPQDSVARRESQATLMQRLL
jgi:hypothetical protein